MGGAEGGCWGDQIFGIKILILGFRFYLLRCGLRVVRNST